MEKATRKKLTTEQAAELCALSALLDERIDTGDIPGVANRSDAERGLLYWPVKRQRMLRLDAEVLSGSNAFAPHEAMFRRSFRHGMILLMAVSD